MWLTAPSPPWQMGRLGQSADEEWYELTMELSERIEPNDVIFVQGGLAEGFLISQREYPDLFKEYVGCRVSRFYLPTDNPRIGLPLLWTPESKVAMEYGAKLRQFHDAGRNLWVAGALDTDLNRASMAMFLQTAKATGFDVGIAAEYPSATLFQLPI